MKIRCSYKKLVPVEELKPHPQNANDHPASQIRQLATILEYQGWRAPIRVSLLSGFITAGHGRLLAAKLNGWKEVPVEYQEYESRAMEFADVIADNSIALQAELDVERIKTLYNVHRKELAPHLLGLAKFEPTPLEHTGYGGGTGSGDEEAPPPPAVPKTKLGDLWTLGAHRILCGDSSNVLHVEALFKGEKVPCLFTDPPYNLASDGKLLAAQMLLPGSYGDLKAAAWDKNFDFSTVSALLRSHVLAADSTAYICTSHFLAGSIWEWMKEWSDFNGFVVWSKPNPMPSLAKRHWTWSAELICYATRGKHTFNFPLQGHALSVWEFNKVQKADLHPTMKPLAVPSHAILHSTNEGDAVADLFLGAGSTLIACEKHKRRLIGMEINPQYVDVCLERWAKETGMDPVSAYGKKWSEVKNG